ncbi:tyrosine-type recombinase/integrase [Avibacterium sp. 20-129]|uniref:tyrosine-type recombinase/integrase n=1 Tax=Avibacterium sp. 20-129 TaxID=2911525 RepID=UPI0022471A3B|nr:tyrosine-type recombinase/integrase [Avibacterium sp. 20-129]MCW9698138.1 tyrosine-type recombinase/integrase [Avibacterium sp. 20-129]
MASIKLTDKIIRSLSPEQLKGDTIENLYIKANKASGSYSWFYIFTNPTNKRQRPKISLGRYPTLSFDEARKIALEYNSLVKQGIDPRNYKAEQEAKAEIEEMTFQQVAELFREYRRESVKDVDDCMRRVELYIYPKFGDIPLNKITLAEWHAYLKPMETAKNNTIKKVAGTSKQILDYALACGYISHNPLTTLRQSFKTVKAKSHPTIPPERLPEFLRDLWLCNSFAYTKNLVEWQLLTTTRANEAVRAKWTDIDFEKKIWTIPAGKMKAGKEHIIALNEQAIKLLDEQRKFTGNHKYIFHSFRSKTNHQSSQSANNAIKNMHEQKYKGVLTSHGLRSIFSTYMHSLHDPLIQGDYIEACLAHLVGNDVSRSYNHSNYATQKHYLMKVWGEYIAKCKHP